MPLRAVRVGGGPGMYEVAYGLTKLGVPFALAVRESEVMRVLRGPLRRGRAIRWVARQGRRLLTGTLPPLR